MYKIIKVKKLKCPLAYIKKYENYYNNLYNTNYKSNNLTIEELNKIYDLVNEDLTKKYK